MSRLRDSRLKKQGLKHYDDKQAVARQRRSYVVKPPKPPKKGYQVESSGCAVTALGVGLATAVATWRGWS